MDDGVVAIVTDDRMIVTYDRGRSLQMRSLASRTIVMDKIVSSEDDRDE